MKIYYDRLSKEDRKELRKNIKNSKFGSLYKKLNYYIFLCYGCFFLIVSDIYFRFYFNGKTLDYVVDAIIMLAVFIFYYKLLKIRETTLNKFALEEKKKTK